MVKLYTSSMELNRHQPKLPHGSLNLCRSVPGFRRAVPEFRRSAPNLRRATANLRRPTPETNRQKPEHSLWPPRLRQQAGYQSFTVLTINYHPSTLN